MNDDLQSRIKMLIQQLSKDNFAQQRAGRELIQIGAPAVEQLIESLEDENPSVRKEAATLLGAIADSRAVEPLILALNDSDYWVGMFAAGSLGRIGDHRAFEPLIEALSKDNFSAPEALAALGDERAIDPLIAGMQDDEGHIHRNYVRALAEFDSDRVIEPLINALRSDYHKEWEPAYWGLVRIGERAVKPLLDSLNPEKIDQCRNIVQTLGEIKDPRAVEPLIRLLETVSQGWTQTTIVEALSNIGDQRAVAPLLALRGTGDKWFEQSLTEALQKLGYDPDLPHE